jgi:hypothetical protein
MVSGLIDRYKGKGYQPSSWLQQVGGGGATTSGGGQVNSTGAASTSGGIPLSTAGTVETTLLSYVLPAKTLDRIGRNALITAFGTFSTANAGAKTARLYYGGTSISLQNSTTVTSLQPWWLQLNVFAQTAQSTVAGIQTVLAQNILSATHGGCSLSTGAEITGLNSTIKVTGISSSPTAATPGDVTAYSLQVEVLN